jgi:hypothetical protein
VLFKTRINIFCDARVERTVSTSQDVDNPMFGKLLLHFQYDDRSRRQPTKSRLGHEVARTGIHVIDKKKPTKFVGFVVLRIVTAFRSA